MKLLDLFCGAGGASMGYHRAGFEVFGVDIKPQKYYPFRFIQADATKIDVFDIEDIFGFFKPDVIHASPPCQAHSALRHLHPEKNYECYLDETRKILINSGLPYIIENVPKAPLINPIQLCGSYFGLKVRRHRLFETNFYLTGVECDHKKQGRPIDVSGTGGRRVNRRPDDHGGSTNKPRNIKEAREAMDMPWSNRYGISQAIPPAYTEFIGKKVMQSIKQIEANVT